MSGRKGVREREKGKKEKEKREREGEKERGGERQRGGERERERRRGSKKVAKFLQWSLPYTPLIKHRTETECAYLK